MVINGSSDKAASESVEPFLPNIEANGEMKSQTIIA